MRNFLGALQLNATRLFTRWSVSEFTWACRRLTVVLQERARRPAAERRTADSGSCEQLREALRIEQMLNDLPMFSSLLRGCSTAMIVRLALKHRRGGQSIYLPLYSLSRMHVAGALLSSLLSRWREDPVRQPSTRGQRQQQRPAAGFRGLSSILPCIRHYSKGPRQCWCAQWPWHTGGMAAAGMVRASGTGVRRLRCCVPSCGSC